MERDIIIYEAHFLHVSKHAHHLTLWKKISVKERKKTQEIKLFPQRDHLTHLICGMRWKLPSVSSFLALSNFPNWRVRLTAFLSFQSDLCHQGFMHPQLPCAHPLFFIITKCQSPRRFLLTSDAIPIADYSLLLFLTTCHQHHPVSFPAPLPPSGPQVWVLV